jgi:hypothetical protein
LALNIVSPDGNNHPKLARTYVVMARRRISPASNGTTAMAGEKVHLTKEKETLLITHHGKVLESCLPDSLRRGGGEDRLRFPEAQGGLASQAG